MSFVLEVNQDLLGDWGRRNCTCGRVGGDCMAKAMAIMHCSGSVALCYVLVVPASFLFAFILCFLVLSQTLFCWCWCLFKNTEDPKECGENLRWLQVGALLKLLIPTVAFFYPREPALTAFFTGYSIVLCCRENPQKQKSVFSSCFRKVASWFT